MEKIIRGTKTRSGAVSQNRAKIILLRQYSAPTVSNELFYRERYFLWENPHSDLAITTRILRLFFFCDLHRDQWFVRIHDGSEYFIRSFRNNCLESGNISIARILSDHYRDHLLVCEVEIFSGGGFGTPPWSAMGAEGAFRKKNCIRTYECFVWFVRLVVLVDSFKTKVSTSPGLNSRCKLRKGLSRTYWTCSEMKHAHTNTNTHTHTHKHTVKRWKDGKKERKKERKKSVFFHIIIFP